jgi:predicted phosphohydrolase
MAHLFAIADTHITHDPQKRMDIFSGWDDYMNRLSAHWQSAIRPEDTVVIAGDICWASDICMSIGDFSFLDNLPGKKILVKGNHDYWWTNITAMRKTLSKFTICSLEFLKNNMFAFGDYAICGATGVDLELLCQNEKNNARNIQRIERSLQKAHDESLRPLLFLHYPPIVTNDRGAIEYSPEIMELIKRFGVSDCYYGHMHGKNAHNAYNTSYRITDTGDENSCFDVNFHFIAADFVQFMPVLVV